MALVALIGSSYKVAENPLFPYYLIEVGFYFGVLFFIKVAFICLGNCHLGGLLLPSVNLGLVQEASSFRTI